MDACRPKRSRERRISFLWETQITINFYYSRRYNHYRPVPSASCISIHYSILWNARFHPTMGCKIIQIIKFMAVAGWMPQARRGTQAQGHTLFSAHIHVVAIRRLLPFILSYFWMYFVLVFCDARRARDQCERPAKWLVNMPYNVIVCMKLNQ